MKVLLIGGGGREHALALKISQSPLKPVLHCAPGNPGMAALGTCHAVSAEDLEGLLALARNLSPDVVVVGPEQPLVLGLTDRLEAAGFRVFGPSRAAAALEGSKAFSKDFMRRHGIPTAAFKTCTRLEEALATLEEYGAPVVVKASGLCAGKGAVVCLTLAEAREAVESMLGEKRIFGEAGAEVVIEEFMEGEEVSLFALCDGRHFILLPSAQDHKRIFDGDRGPNTGGMGAYSPAPALTPALSARVEREIVEPTLRGMAEEGRPYRGILFVGLMLTEDGPKVVEYNCRLGDPETQAVLPVMEGDLLGLLVDAVEGRLKPGRVDPALAPARHAAVVVLASEGYPGPVKKGRKIEGLQPGAPAPGITFLQAGTAMQDGALVTAGGRVLGVVGEGATLAEALRLAYQGVEAVRFEGMQYRRDIGARGLRH